MLFLSPREQGRACLGTWYCPPEKIAGRRELEDKEVQDALQDFSSAFPHVKISPSDVLAHEVGYIPARGIKNGKADVLHREEIYDYAGYIEVVSTKLTTFQMQAERVYNIAQRYLKEKS
jgi:glycerol-3-phosphate dehydrogenase